MDSEDREELERACRFVFLQKEYSALFGRTEKRQFEAAIIAVLTRNMSEGQWREVLEQARDVMNRMALDEFGEDDVAH